MVPSWGGGADPPGAEPAEEDSAGDAWASVEVPSSFILDSDYARGEAWTYLRSQLREEFGKGEA